MIDPEEYVGYGTPQPSPVEAADALAGDAELREHLAGIGLELRRQSAAAETPPDAATLLTAAQVAAMLNVSSQRVWALSRDGKIPTVRLGRQTLRYRRDAVLEWLAAIESGE